MDHRHWPSPRLSNRAWQDGDAHALSDERTNRREIVALTDDMGHESRCRTRGREGVSEPAARFEGDKGLIAQVRHGDGPSLGQRVPGRSDEEQVLVEERLYTHHGVAQGSGSAVPGDVQDGEVEAPSGEQPHKLLGAILLQLDLDARVARVKRVSTSESQ